MSYLDLELFETIVKIQLENTIPETGCHDDCTIHKVINYLTFSNKGLGKDPIAHNFLWQKMPDFKHSEKTSMGSKKVTKALFSAVIGTLSNHVSKTNESGWK